MEPYHLFREEKLEALKKKRGGLTQIGQDLLDTHQQEQQRYAETWNEKDLSKLEYLERTFKLAEDLKMNEAEMEGYKKLREERDRLLAKRDGMIIPGPAETVVPETETANPQPDIVSAFPTAEPKLPESPQPANPWTTDAKELRIAKEQIRLREEREEREMEQRKPVEKIAKAAELAKRTEDMGNSKRVLEENKITKEEDRVLRKDLQTELEEVNQRNKEIKILTSGISSISEEALKDIKENIENLNIELYSLNKKIREKKDELESISPVRIFKYRKVKKEVEKLGELIDKNLKLRDKEHDKEEAKKYQTERINPTKNREREIMGVLDEIKERAKARDAGDKQAEKDIRRGWSEKQAPSDIKNSESTRAQQIAEIRARLAKAENSSRKS